MYLKVTHYNCINFSGIFYDFLIDKTVKAVFKGNKHLI